MNKKLFVIIVMLLSIYALAFSQSNYGFELIGRVLPGEANVAFSVDNRCYLGAGNVLQVLDVSDQDQLEPLGFINLLGTVEDVFVVGNLAYVANDDEGLIIVDISDPSEITQIGCLSFTNSAFSIYVQGDYAYIAALEGGLIIVDISNPQAPYQVGSFYVEWAALNVDVQDNIACVASGYGGLYILDVSNPSSPIQTGLIDYQSTWAYDVKIDGDHAFLGYSLEQGGGGLYAIDISNPYNPQIASSRSFAESARRLDYDSGYLFIALEQTGMLIVDVNAPCDPQIIGGWPNGYANNICFSDDKIFVTGDEEGLRIFQASNLNNPQLLYEYLTFSKGQNLVVADQYVYLAEQPSGFKVIDITNPKNAEVIYSDKFFLNPNLNRYGGISSDINVVDNYLYISSRVDIVGGDHDFRVFDISNPAQPNLLGIYTGNLYTSVHGFCISRELAYLAFGNSLRIVDVAYPDEMELASDFDCDWDKARGMDLVDDVLYLATSQTGLYILDVSNEINPDVIASLNTDGDSYDAKYFDGHVYLSDWDNGLRIINVVEPLVPFEVASFGEGDYEHCLDVAFIEGQSNSYAIVCFDDEIIALDITNPYDPLPVGFFDTGDPHGVFTRGDTIFVADRDNGLYVLLLENQVGIKEKDNPSLPQDYFSARNFPNPFNSSTIIEFSTTNQSRVTVDIYDLLGQRVATLFDGKAESGINKVIWDGKDSHGQSVSSGVYFYKISDDMSSVAKRLVYIK